MNNTDVKRWFEGLPLSAAEFFRICDKCKYAIRINGGRHEYHYLGKCKPEARDSSESRQFQPTSGGTAHMGYERCGRCGFKLSEHGSPGFQCPATGTPPLKMADEPTASEPTNWNAMGYCAKHQAPMLDHEGCYVCKTAVTLPPMTERQTDWQIASPKAEPPSLSLLVCDFGDWRVLYHEHGDAWTLAVNEWEFRFDDDRDAHLTRLPFADIKAAIDAQLEDVPPVRIELGEDGDYHLYGNGITGFRLIPEEYYLLCELAGQVGATQNLPIYEPKRGTWTEIGHIDDEVYRNSEIRVWRFTR